jgi:hypothetical protein
MMDNLPEKSATSSQILLYQTEDGRSRIEVRLEDETVWLSQDLMAELFQTTKQNISLHIHNIFPSSASGPLNVCGNTSSRALHWMTIASNRMTGRGKSS